MKKKVTNRIWGIIVLNTIILYSIGVFGLLIKWGLFASIICFIMGGCIYPFYIFTKKSRACFIKDFFSCYYITEDSIVRAAGNRVYFSLNKTDIIQIVVGKMKLGIYGSKKCLIVLRNEDTLVCTDYYNSSFPPNKIIINFPYSRKKIIEEWWGQPIEKFNISF